MDIQSYILDHWKSKMDARHPVLVIYDKDGVYQDLLPLAKESGIYVVDTTNGILHSRLIASRVWCNELSLDSDARLIIYRKEAIPSNNRSWIEDPFAAFVQSGVLFPLGPQDSYENLCKAFLPAKTKELDQLFNTGSTSFNMINALLDGAAYPELEQLTGGKSVIEITTGVLTISDSPNTKWLKEWERFAEIQFPGLDASNLNEKEVQQKLWTYLLFSEFVFDLPEKLPANLNSIPIAPIEMKDKIYLICDKLRNQNSLREVYVRQSNKIAQQLDLASIFAKFKHLGDRVTFCFENSVEYDRFIDALKEGNAVEARALWDKNDKGVWSQEDPEVNAFWKLSEYALSLVDCVYRGIETDNGTLDKFVTWYANSGCIADNAFRKYHTKRSGEASLPEQVKQLTELVNAKYRDFTERGVSEYQRLISQLKDFPNLRNQGCIQYVYPALQQGKRVVLAFVDAFRYEMGKSFADGVNRSFKDRVTCEPKISYLPSVTRFGMANHLGDISAEVQNGKLNPVIDSESIVSPEDRIKFLKKKTGVEIQDVRLEDFDDTTIDSSVRLLVIRSTGIDTAGEKEKLSGLPSMEHEITRLSKAINECKRLKFDTAVIVADHGFMIQPKFNTGDLISKPSGSNIILEESRLIVGNLNDTPDTLSFAPADLDVNVAAMKMCYAKNYTIFTKGEVYYHEGLSLQENVVPIITVNLQEDKKKSDFRITLAYKGSQTGTVYNCRALIDINTQFDDLFSDDAHVKITVTGDEGKPIGSPEGKFYNEVTSLVDIPAGVTQFRQPISIDEEYHGSTLTVTVYDANTNATLTKITLNYEND